MPTPNRIPCQSASDMDQYALVLDHAGLGERGGRGEGRDREGRKGRPAEMPMVAIGEPPRLLRLCPHLREKNKEREKWKARGGGREIDRGEGGVEATSEPSRLLDCRIHPIGLWGQNRSNLPLFHK